ncbi:MAG: hypothetical protein HQL72_09180 [Magnetococcales bacterium]|nr:hypothetical protein [Magnetococcales bacterium]
MTTPHTPFTLVSEADSLRCKALTKVQDLQRRLDAVHSLVSFVPDDERIQILPSGLCLLLNDLTYALVDIEEDLGRARVIERQGEE